MAYTIKSMADIKSYSKQRLQELFIRHGRPSGNGLYLECAGAP